MHCVVRTGRSDRAYHGVAVAWFDDEADLAAHDRHEATVAGPLLVERSTIVQARVEERVVAGEELLARWWADPERGSRLLVLGIIQRRPALSREQFRDYWWDQHRPLANRVLPDGVLPPIYVHNYALPGEPCPWDGVGEFYDTSVDGARRRAQMADTGAAAEIVADEEQFLVPDTRYGLVTDAEIVLPGADP
jgi:hypothetical protein